MIEPGQADEVTLAARGREPGCWVSLRTKDGERSSGSGLVRTGKPPDAGYRARTVAAAGELALSDP